MAATYVKGKLYQLKLADLLTDQAQARKFMDPVSLNELTESIKKYGVITPILFCQNAEVKPVVVAGHRRVAASLLAGLREIPGTFTDGDTRLQGFVENIQREGLTPIEEAEEMDALMKEYVMNKYQLADAIGKSKSSVYDSLTLTKLPEDIRSASRTNPNISKNLLLEVARQKSESTMRRKFETLMAKAASAGKVKTPTTPKTIPTAQRLLITKTDELTGEFMELPWQEWSEDDRNDLINALYGIRRQTDRLLVDMDAPPQEGEEETTGGSNLA